MILSVTSRENVGKKRFFLPDLYYSTQKDVHILLECNISFPTVENQLTRGCVYDTLSLDRDQNVVYAFVFHLVSTNGGKRDIEISPEETQCGLNILTLLDEKTEHQNCLEEINVKGEFKKGEERIVTNYC